MHIAGGDHSVQCALEAPVAPQLQVELAIYRLNQRSSTACTKINTCAPLCTKINKQDAVVRRRRPAATAACIGCAIGRALLKQGVHNSTNTARQE